MVRVVEAFRRSALLAAAAMAVACGSAAAQTPVKFTLDWKFEGPAAPFLVAIDKGYYKAEGLDVTVDTAGGSLEPLNRIASGTYDIGFGDINSLIKFRDANPNVPIKAVFMVYNKPPFSIVARKSRGVQKPKDLEGKKLGAPAPDGAFAQWKIFTQANGIDPSKVTIENVGFPVREPMLAARPGRRHHRLLVLVLYQPEGSRRAGRRHRRAADVRLRRQSLRQRDHRESEIRRREAGSRQEIPQRLPEGPEGHREVAGNGGRFGDQAQRRRQEGRRARTPEDGAEGQYPHQRSEGERLRRGRYGPSRQVDRPDRRSPTTSRIRSRRAMRSSIRPSCRRPPIASSR